MVLFGEAVLLCGGDSIAAVIRMHVMLCQVYVLRAKKNTQLSSSSNPVKIKSKPSCSESARSTDLLRICQGTSWQGARENSVILC